MKHPCYSFILILSLIALACCSGCRQCETELCLNGGECGYLSCHCPYHTFGDHCEESAPIGFALQEIKLLSKPDLMTSLGNHPEAEYQLVIKLTTDAQSYLREIALNQAETIAFRTSAHPTIMQFDPETFGEFESKAEYLKHQKITVNVSCEYFYFDEDCQRGNLQQRAIRHFSIPLQHLYQEGARDFSYLYHEKLKEGEAPLSFVLEGSWIL